MADQPRSFSRATLGGNSVGRPATRNTDSSSYAKALIAANRWQQKRGGSVGQRTPANSSAQSGADIAAARGQYRAERRFADESNFFNPDASPL
jgi:hypothetical protein